MKFVRVGEPSGGRENDRWRSIDSWTFQSKILHTDAAPCNIATTTEVICEQTTRQLAGSVPEILPR